MSVMFAVPSDIVAGLKWVLESLGWPVWDTDATGAKKYPYILFLPSAFGQDPEHSLGGPRRGIRDEVMVRAVGLSAPSVRGVLGRTRDVMTREGRPLTFDTEAHRMTLTLQPGAAPILVDRDVKATGTNTHPLFATDTYTLTAVPLT